MSSYDLTAKIFQDADAAREHLEALRWPSGAVCPHCGCLGATELKGSKNRAHREPAPKKAVVALVERDGAVKSFHVANVTGATLRPIIVKHVSRKSMLMTDEAVVYTKIGQEFANHGTVNHSAGEYTRKGHFYHSNTVDNFFSIFKRGVIGVYHHLSEAILAATAQSLISAITPARKTMWSVPRSPCAVSLASV
jgi:hypothetical protein